MVLYGVNLHFSRGDRGLFLGWIVSSEDRVLLVERIVLRVQGPHTQHAQSSVGLVLHLEEC